MRTATAIELAPEVSDLIDHIATRCCPAQIILFGSHAVGRTHTELTN